MPVIDELGIPVTEQAVAWRTINSNGAHQQVVSFELPIAGIDCGQDRNSFGA
jgi:hypothetical protein